MKRELAATAMAHLIESPSLNSSGLNSAVLPCKTGAKLTKLELRALDAAVPVDWSAARIDDRLMSGVVESAMAPTKLHGKSPWCLHINMHGLTVGMAPGSHADGRFAQP